MESVIGVLILDEVVLISYPWERHESDNSHSCYGWVLEQTRFFNFGLATNLEEENSALRPGELCFKIDFFVIF